MSFFDLSIPYLDKVSCSTSDKNKCRDSRLRTVARAMELGYTAVAYDFPFRGVLSNADRCSIAPFPAQYFLDSVVGGSSAAFTASVAFHRSLLGVPRASPFRQYTRITVSVDSAAAASALNCGNRLLRSYDLVATRPLNQIAFDQACNVSEVDIISLDFSQKLPFRLKLAMVQAAIKRGVHFEISYSHIIADGHAKRQILSEAKRLSEWTRGKNLIISGSATSLNEVRGPNDVANLSTILLGLTMERAKAAISANCRSLVANALRKKDCYFKEAIKIERIFSEGKMDSEGDWFKEWNDWDPISSGVNDLPSLDDMTKVFTSASKHSKTQNTIDFSSSINGMAPNTPLFSFANKRGLDSDGNHVYEEVERHNIDNVFVENVKEVIKPCSNEIGMAIDALGSPRTGIPILDKNCLLLNTNTPMDYSFVGFRDEVSMVDDATTITKEEHCLQKIKESKAIISSSFAQFNGYSDKVELHEQSVAPLEATFMRGKKQVASQLETRISDDPPLKTDHENQQDFTASKSMILLDSSAKLNVQENIFSKINDSKGFDSKTKSEKKHAFSLKEEHPEIDFSAKKSAVKMEVGVVDHHFSKSGKRRWGRRSHRPGYLLAAKNIFKSMLFKKKAGQLVRKHKFLEG